MVSRTVPVFLQGIGALFALAILGLSPGQAQDRVIRGGAAGEFDFYVLALSWSPGFCTLEGDSKNRDQCRSGSGLGFVVHGHADGAEPLRHGDVRGPDVLRGRRGMHGPQGVAHG
jgi:ribonuclease I